MLKIQITGVPEARTMLRRAGKNLGLLQAVLGEEARQRTEDHLLELHRSRSGKSIAGARGTGFYAQAARATTVAISGDSATITIDKQGMAQRYYGGTIRPVNAKWLTIPVTARAYGRRARDFGQPLQFRAIRRGRMAVLFERSAGQRVATRFKVHYVLVRSITQKPDPSVLPTTKEYSQRLVAEGTAFLNSLA